MFKMSIFIHSLLCFTNSRQIFKSWQFFLKPTLISWTCNIFNRYNIFLFVEFFSTFDIPKFLNNKVGHVAWISNQSPLKSKQYTYITFVIWTGLKLSKIVFWTLFSMHNFYLSYCKRYFIFVILPVFNYFTALDKINDHNVSTIPEAHFTFKLPT